MLRKRKQSRRKPIQLSQMVRELGPRTIKALRHARVGLWRFKRNPAQRDRAAMYATFAFIGFFAVGSVDAIITGRADFAPHAAYAAEYRPTSFAAPAPVVTTAAVEEPATVEALKVTEVDYSFTTETLLGGPVMELASLEDVAPEVPALGAINGGKFDISKPNAGADLDDLAL